MHWISIKEFKYYCIAVCFAFLGGINAHNISGFNFKRVIDFSVRNCRRNRIFRWHCAAKAYRLLAQLCAVCGRPFEWRKKWQKVWDEVKYCSEKCRRNRNSKDSSGSDSSFNSQSNFNLTPRKLFHSSSARPIFAASVFLSNLYILDRVSSNSLAMAVEFNTRPTVEEIKTVFSSENGWPNDVDCKEYDTNARTDSFRRLDESPDDIFYKNARFVEHIDAAAVVALTSFHGQQLQNLANEIKDKLRVLDLCSSWVSHIPPSAPTQVVSGLGMNREELQRNEALNGDIVVQDLNSIRGVRLPFADADFHVVLIQLSIDYLIYPVEVLREVARVLKPRGLLIISFSNRVFIDKAVSLWSGKADIDHIDTVGSYIYCASQNGDDGRSFRGFDLQSIKAVDIFYEMSSSKRSYKNDSKDPLYAVIARAV